MQLAAYTAEFMNSVTILTGLWTCQQKHKQKLMRYEWSAFCACVALHIAATQAVDNVWSPPALSMQDNLEEAGTSSVTKLETPRIHQENTLSEVCKANCVSKVGVMFFWHQTLDKTYMYRQTDRQRFVVSKTA